jgi:hypothetical protein
LVVVLDTEVDFVFFGCLSITPRLNTGDSDEFREIEDDKTDSE